jgi:hypothetical protein
LPDQREIIRESSHGRRILRRRGDCLALPPARQSTLSSSSHSNTSTSQGGYDAPVQFQVCAGIDGGWQGR